MAKLQEVSEASKTMVEERPMDPREQMIRDLRPPGTPPTELECIVPETGEEFTAEIGKSDAFPQGRVIRVKNLKMPPEMVPVTLYGEANTPIRKQWIYEHHYKKILRQFVGKSAAHLGVYRKDMQEKIRKALAEVV